MTNIFRISGLATGLDTDKIVGDLMKVQRIPVDKLKQNKQIYEWKREDLREINLALLNFRATSGLSMKLQSTFQAKLATSTNESIITATPTTSSANTSYTVNVSQIAEVAWNASSTQISTDLNNAVDTSATLMSQKDKLAGGAFFDTHSTFSFTLKTYNYDGTTNEETFTFDANTQSLNDVLSTISNSSLGLNALYAKGATKDGVSLTTTRTGDNNSSGQEIVVTDTDGFLNDVLKISQANEAGGKDAFLTINGLEVVQHTNDFTFNNVNFQVKAKTASMNPQDAVTITIKIDADTIFNNIKTFIDDYNSLIEKINSKLKEERYRDYLPLTEEQREKLTDKQIEKWEEKARSGLLQNDYNLNKIASNMRLTMSSIVEGLPATLNMLSQIGITTQSYYEYGKLYVDETKLRVAITSNPEGVMNLFTQTGSNDNEKGIGQRIYDAVNNGINQLIREAGNPNGFTLYETDNLMNSIRNVDKRINTLEDRLSEIEERYWRQFTALETAISQMNTQSAWLSQQFARNT